MSISLSQEELWHAHPWKIWINSKVKEGVLPHNDYLCCQYHPRRIKNKYYNLILISRLTAISKIKIHHNTKQLVKNMYLASARKWERDEQWSHRSMAPLSAEMQLSMHAQHRVQAHSIQGEVQRLVDAFSCMWEFSQSKLAICISVLNSLKQSLPLSKSTHYSQQMEYYRWQMYISIPLVDSSLVQHSLSSMIKMSTGRN